MDKIAIACIVAGCFCLIIIVLLVLLADRTNDIFEDKISESEYNDLKSLHLSIWALTILICGMCFLSAITVFQENKKPQAIDVYRNKTELIITSVNDVPKDTTIVFKK